jgi:hypothetical protein
MGEHFAFRGGCLTPVVQSLAGRQNRRNRLWLVDVKAGIMVGLIAFSPRRQNIFGGLP